jgi:dihydrofolate reductase
MGSHTYEWVLNHEKLLDHPNKWPYTQPTWVLTHRDLPKVSGADLRMVQGDVAAVHAEMVRAAQGKNVWIVGGGELAGQFLDLGLLDELILTLAPVLLESGKPLLPRTLKTPPLKLMKAETFDDVFATLTYAIVHEK